MSTIASLVDQIRNYLDNEDWKYEYAMRNDRPVIEFGLNIRGKLSSLKYFITFRDNGYTVVAVPKLNASEDVRDTIVTYLTMANYGLLNGNFECDVRDGEVRYKVYTNTNGIPGPSDAMIEDSIMIPAAMFERYGDGLAALMMGFSDPKTEIEKAENK